MMESKESGFQEATLLPLQMEDCPATPPYSLHEGHGDVGVHTVSPGGAYTGPRQVPSVVSALPTQKPYMCCCGRPAHCGAIALGVFELFCAFYGIISITTSFSATCSLFFGNYPHETSVMVPFIVALISPAISIICTSLMFGGIFFVCPALVLPNIAFHCVQCVLVGLIIVLSIIGGFGIRIIMIKVTDLCLLILFTRIVRDSHQYLVYEFDWIKGNVSTAPIDSIS
jgi:hypothetical protein